MKAKVLIPHVVLPIVAGGLIYVCWRDPALLMFKWFRLLGGEPFVLQLRVLAAPARPALPFWFLYSLPDGLWVYAFTSFMVNVWSGSRASLLKIACLSAGPVIGAGSELGQLAGVIPGSFDRTDFLFYIAAGALALFAVSRLNSGRSINERSNEENVNLFNRAGRVSAAGLRQRILDEQEYFKQ